MGMFGGGDIADFDFLAVVVKNISQWAKAIDADELVASSTLFGLQFGFPLLFPSCSNFVGLVASRSLETRAKFVESLVWRRF